MAPFHIAEVAQSKEKLPSQVGRDRVGRSLRFQIAKADDLRLLRTRSERPSRRAAEQRDEVAPFHCPIPPVLDGKDSTPGGSLVGPAVLRPRQPSKLARSARPSMNFRDCGLTATET